MAKQTYIIRKTIEFEAWFTNQTKKEQIQIDKRLAGIELYGHLGDHRVIDESKGLFELRWLNGRRVYYVQIEINEMIILYAGNKNGQSKDINKAKNILAKKSN